MSTDYEQPGIATVALMVTRRCNMACAHCSVESSSKIRQQPSEEELVNIVTQAADAGVKAILFTGGEPMLREAILVRLMSLATRYGIASGMTSNGFWGKTLPQARRTLATLKKAGLRFFTLSYDRYHAEFQGPEPAKNVLRAAEELRIPMNVNVTRVANDSDMGTLLAPFDESRHAKIRFYDVQSVGRAKDLPEETLRGKVEGRCFALQIPAITDDGRMTACNGPSYFLPPSSSLALGSLKDSSVADLLKKHRDDPILQTVRLFGPGRLREELSQIPGFENFRWKQSYTGLCDLCLHINSNEAASAALRDRLSDPSLVAERAARQMVIDGITTRGETGREYVIGPAAAKLWMSGARGARIRNTRMWREDAARTLGRADSDWRQMSDYLAACGLSAPMLEVARDEAVARWAPSIVAERLQAKALRGARRDLIQRQVLKAIDAELTELGSRGVLLKGGATLALELSEPQRFGQKDGQLPRRACGDIDVVVDPRFANALRQRLIARGATGATDDPRTAPHHLAAVSLWGIPIEIHTRIMPSWWKLPESEMLEKLEPCTKFNSLFSLGPEAMLLHAFMHCSSHLFAYGLKTAWDAAWIVERYDRIDWRLVRSWANRTAMSAGFYLPARVMRSALGIALPAEVFADAPAHARYTRLEQVAWRRLFVAMEGTSELNPITKHGIFLLLHDTWRGRALHVSSLFRHNEREARAARPHPRSIRMQLRESMTQLETYRKFAKSDAAAAERYEALFDDSPDSERTTVTA
jgi:hypothetical protein